MNGLPGWVVPTVPASLIGRLERHICVFVDGGRGMSSRCVIVAPHS